MCYKFWYDNETVHSLRMSNSVRCGWKAYSLRTSKSGIMWSWKRKQMATASVTLVKKLRDRRSLRTANEGIINSRPFCNLRILFYDFIRQEYQNKEYRNGRTWRDVTYGCSRRRNSFIGIVIRSRSSCDHLRLPVTGAMFLWIGIEPVST